MSVYLNQYVLLLCYIFFLQKMQHLHVNFISAKIHDYHGMQKFMWRKSCDFLEFLLLNAKWEILSYFKVKNKLILCDMRMMMTKLCIHK
jgi:hypothetical protein